MIRAILLCSLLVASACTVADDSHPPTEPRRTVSVTGTATATAEPDSALVQMGVSIRATELAAAQRGVADKTNALLAMTDRLGIDRGDVDTTGANVRPEYRWNRNTEQQEFVGYLAERQISVTLKALDKLGQLIEGAVAAGVNQVSPPVLKSSERESAYREALKLAALDAKGNAEVLAASLGATLGEAVTVNASSVVPFQPRPMMEMAAVARDSNAPASYNPGDLTFNATVSVTFTLVY